MLKFILLGVAACLAGVLIAAALRPAEIRYRRSLAMKAPPQRIHAFINDFRAWTRWSPYEHLDPAMQREYGATTAGVGATYGWSGNAKVGAGHMKILESSPGRIVIQLDFLRPFVAHNTATFTLEPRGDETEVSWQMQGPASFPVKLMGLFINMDAMVGRDFERGLASLRTLSEDGAAEATASAGGVAR